MWYVIQTVTGKEQELVDTVDRVIPHTLYERCFLLRRECSWRVGGGYENHIETLFPSYVFIITDTAPELFYALKKVPQFSRLLREDATFWTVHQDEEEFLENLTDHNPDYIVPFSRVKVDAFGKIIAARGPLAHYLDKIVKQRLRKRCVYVEIPLAGKTHRVLLGVIPEKQEKKA